jgi:hypothetical protein
LARFVDLPVKDLSSIYRDEPSPWFPAGIPWTNPQVLYETPPARLRTKHEPHLHTTMGCDACLHKRSVIISRVGTLQVIQHWLLDSQNVEKRLTVPSSSLGLRPCDHSPWPEAQISSVLGFHVLRIPDVTHLCSLDPWNANISEYQLNGPDSSTI